MSALIRLAGWLLWAWRLAKGWLPQLLGSGATVFGIIWGAYGPGIWTSGAWAFVLAICLAIGSIVAQCLLQRPTYMELFRQRDLATESSTEKSRAIEEAFTVLLRKLAEHCTVASNSDRASVYYFHEETFVMLARWSTHPTYTRPGRGRYPTGQGAIGAAWDSGSVVTVLSRSRARWNTSLEKHHGFPAGVPATLAMHAQSIAGIRIETAHHAVGVLIFESLDPQRASQETLDKAASSMLFATLSELVGAVASPTPQVEQLVAAAEERRTTFGPNWKPLAPGSA